MSRLTPFEYVFAELAEERFGEVQKEAEQQLKDTADRTQFASLPSVQRILADLERPELIDAAPEAAAEYLNVVYAAYRYWEAGRPLISLDRETLQAAVASPAPSTIPEIPAGACYVQLPERLVWAQIAPEEPHEPVDGLFVASGPDGREITVVAVLGFRPARGGFSQVTAVAMPHEFAAALSEARTPPFAPVLDGGDRAGFKSIVNAAELLLLTQLALARRQS